VLDRRVLGAISALEHLGVCYVGRIPCPTVPDTNVMATLANAPLIEAIFELRWGTLGEEQTGGRLITFQRDEGELLPGALKAELAKVGFHQHELVNPQLPPVPHLVRHRYRAAENKWPCYQLGLGVFTANQVNEGYQWEAFRKAILAGLECLGNVFPGALKEMPVLGFELRYQDGFFFQEDEGSLAFLENKLQIRLDIPKAFCDSSDVEGRARAHQLEFSLKTKNPKGILATHLLQAHINGRKGMVMNTVVRSADEDLPARDMDSISTWLTAAHSLQSHAFETIIARTFAETFK